MEKSLLILHNNNEELTSSLMKDILLNMAYGLKKLLNEKDSNSKLIFMQNQINRLEM